MQRSPPPEPHAVPGERDDDRIVRLVAERARGQREGLFGPGSITWTILRESVLLFGGPRAVLLQLAHPAVDAGIEQHSAVASDPLGRSVRTFTSVYTLSFGDLPSALSIVRSVARRHAVVRGATSRGEPYRALDPRLLRWVFATLFDTTVKTFEAFVRPLTDAERARLHEESSLVQIAFGIPPDEVITSSADFDAYMAPMLDGDALRVTPHAVAQWDMLASQRPSSAVPAAFLLPPTRTVRALADLPPLRALYPAGLRLFAAGTLPPRVREAYGLRWTERDARLFDLAVAAIRTARAGLPSALRYHPAYRSALARVAS